MTYAQRRRTADYFLAYGVLCGLIGFALIFVASPLVVGGLQPALMLFGFVLLGFGILLSLLGGNIHG
jgi:hypothetical protein